MYIYTSSLKKLIDAKAALSKKVFVCEGSAVFTLENVNTTQRWCCCWRRIDSTRFLLFARPT